MKRTRLSRPKRASSDAARLIALAERSAESSCRLEDQFWDAKLTALIKEMLEDTEEDAITGALDQAYNAGNGSFEVLADLVEASAESCSLDAEGTDYEAVLIAAPVLAWSRYSIPSGTLSEALRENLYVQMSAHILADKVKLALADFLFSPDQLPDSYCLTADLTRNLAECVLADEELRVDPNLLRETVQFLSDTRYILGVAVVPKGGAIFRWQEEDGSRQAALDAWQKQGLPCITPMLPACATEALLPQPFHAACRDSDRKGRPFAIQASVSYLQATLSIAADDIMAVIAPFHHQRLEEYRVSFVIKSSQAVVHGVVWPLLDSEDDSTDCVNQIETVLKACGVETIKVLNHRFPLEYCDDCGAPLYPSPEGEPVHAEMPESDVDVPHQLH